MVLHRRSCITQLLTIINDWVQILDDKKPVDVIYLIYIMQKAFNKVPHVRLLTKLRVRGYGIHGRFINWITEFCQIGVRTQYVNVGGECSEEVAVISGLPRGVSWVLHYLFTLLMICQKF